MPKNVKNVDLTTLKSKVDKIAPKNLFDQELQRQFFYNLIYTSSVVEGVKLSQSQVKQIVSQGKKSSLLKRDPSKHLLQAYGQLQALEQIERWAKQTDPLTVDHLLKLHQIVFGQIDSTAGNYRTFHVKLRSSNLMPSLPFVISADMRDFNNQLVAAQRNLTQDNLSGIIDLITYCYHGINRIHPFYDGNGRSARLLTNLILRRFNLPYIVIPKVANVKKVRTALRAADMGDISLLIEFMEQFLAESLKQVINYWQSKKTSI